MLPKIHILLGIIFSLSFWYLFPQIGFLGFAIIFASSVLIDVDHYLFYAYTRKDWNYFHAKKWFMDKTMEFRKMPKGKRKKLARAIPCIFHGIEAIIILLFLSLFSNIFFFILIGFLFHEFLDLIGIIYWGYDLNHILSQTRNILRYKK
ncbi:hypothetical protein J4466_00180 [Candidatus Pacearchaeota archaeon]|nr:hypothetical protein [Candidatus Pacearchaeota archaeon]